MTTVRRLLSETQERLALSGVDDARLEAELLWMTALNTDRAILYAQLQETPEPAVRQTASALLERRLRREPAAYLMGRREFYGLAFHVEPGVFIPRPETETLVEEALRLAPQGPVTVADVGTGSGAIAISVAVSRPEATVYATDISHTALETAALNAREHGVGERVRLLRGDLLSPLRATVDLVLANLPYVMSSEIPTLEPEIRLFEPLEALDGGDDGLDLVARLLAPIESGLAPIGPGLATAPPYLNPGGSLLLELDPRQMERAARLALRAFPQATTRVVPDLAGRPRVLVVSLP